MKTRMFTAIVIVLTCVVFLLPLVGSRSATYADQYQRNVALWQARFLTQDVSTVYRQFLRDGRLLPPDKAHTLAHIIGMLLYDSKKMDGIAYCNDAFDYGCYHGFAGRVLELNGPSGVQQLTSACTAINPYHCEHGVGHGILAYVGDAHLNDALHLCPDGTYNEICVNGVFMEYFLNSMQKSTGRGLLPYSAATPDAACLSGFDAQFRTSCYYELPALWRAWLAMAQPDYRIQFKTAGDLCMKVRDDSMRQSCFSGIGTQSTPYTEYDALLSTQLCESLPVEGRQSCVTSAMRAVKGAAREIHQAEQITI